MSSNKDITYDYTGTQATPDITPVQAEMDLTPKEEPTIWDIPFGYENWKFLFTSPEQGVSSVADSRISRYNPRVSSAIMYCTKTGYIVSIYLKEALPSVDYFVPGEVVAFQPNEQIGCTDVVVRAVTRIAHSDTSETVTYNLDFPQYFYSNNDYQEKYLKPRLKAIVNEFRDSLIATDIED